MSLFNNWTVGRRLIAGFGLSALTLVMVAVRVLPQRQPADRERCFGRAQPSGPLAARRPVVGAKRRRNRSARLSSSPAMTATSIRTSRRSAAIEATLADFQKLDGRQPRPAAAAGRRSRPDRRQAGGAQTRRSICDGPKASMPLQGHRHQCRQDAYGPDPHHRHRGRSGGARRAQAAIRRSARQRRYDAMRSSCGAASLGTLARLRHRLAHHPVAGRSRSAPPSARCAARRPSCRPPPTSRRPAPRSRRPR